MSWFGGGGQKKDDDAGSFTDSYSSGSSSASSYSTGSSLGASGPSRSLSSFQQELVQEQQKAMVQGVMLKLTEISFENCVTKPSSSLSSTERSCISAVVSKYMDTSEFVIGRMSQQR